MPTSVPSLLRNAIFRVAAAVLLVLASAGACSRAEEIVGFEEPDAAGGVGGVAGTEGGIDVVCEDTCSDDGRAVLRGCDRTPQPCGALEACSQAECKNACALAEARSDSVGCDYFAVNMDLHPPLAGACFAAFVTNTFGAPAHIGLSFQGTAIDLSAHAVYPRGSGSNLRYEPYDPAKGIPPGDVAILFLSNYDGLACPVAAARRTGGFVLGTGVGDAFRIRSDVPVVAFQMLPYGGGSAAVTGSSLLLPTSAWGTNYLAVNAWEKAGDDPSLNIVAAEDDTTVTLLPSAPVVGRSGLVQGGPIRQPIQYELQAGEYVQLTQAAELTGSIVQATKRVAVFGGTQCAYVPSDLGYCDHAEQQLPPVRALASEYLLAPYRPRIERETRFLFRVVGAVDGTKLSFEPPVPGAPTELQRGTSVTFYAPGAFIVKSQGGDHPFLAFSYMTASEPLDDYGDPEFVRSVPPKQWLDRYVFFTDPTYPETHLVVTRARSEVSGRFEDVTLDCAGTLADWKPVGADGRYEVTRVDLVRHDFEPQGRCNNGVQQMASKAPFGVTVWGWGTPETSGGVCDQRSGVGIFTCNVSYGFPAGERVQPLNDIVIPPVPR